MHILTELLARGVCINGVSSEGWTGLQLAVNRNQTEVVKLLLKQHALEVSLLTQKQTALHIAASQGKLNILNLLLLKGADPCIKHSSGQNSLDVA